MARLLYLYLSMKYTLLLLFTAVLSLQLQNMPFFFKKKAYIKLSKIEKLNLKGDIKKIYTGSLTGKKRGISKKLKSALKSYGLLHLLTPSGLHLNSLMPLLLLPKVLQLLTLFLFLIWIQSYSSYFSLERIIIFALIQRSSQLLKLSLTTNKIFILTTVLSLLIGNVEDSPHSFLYSFLFWGTILLFRQNPFKLILFLNLSLHFIAMINSETVLLGSIIINPLFSFIFISIFPLLIINLLTVSMLDLTPIIEKFLSLWTHSLIGLYEAEINYSISFFCPTLIILILYSLKKEWKKMIFILCLNITNLNCDKGYVVNEAQTIRTTNCSYNYYRLKCKKKAFSKRRPYKK